MSTDIDTEPENDQEYDPADYDNEVLALAKHLEIHPDLIKDDAHNRYHYGRMEYIVADDKTADRLYDAELDNYIEEIVLPEMPENLRYYFDDDKWKKDAQIDGRGHSLASYDGAENEEEINGETYYIYRTN